jgi:hypothetical protein
METSPSNHNKFAFIKIGYNLIGDKGVKLLTNNDWPQLKSIGLSNLFIIQINAMSQIGEFLTFRKYSGRN